MTGLPRVALIGVGSSGLPTVKALVTAGLDVTAYEAGSRVGGNWVLHNDNGMSSAYESLHINTSRERMEYSDFPMPTSYPDYPHHSHVAEYFQAYADHFDLHRHVRYSTRVESVVPRPGPAGSPADGSHGWTVTADDGTTEDYDAVVVANGHHWDPRWPEPAYPGHLDGEQLHAHHYRSRSQLEGRRVLVVGMGNSAMDIAVESSHVSEATYLSARRGTWVVPKYSAGRPGDQHPLVVNPRIPWRLKEKLIRLVVTQSVGTPQQHGLPAPEHGLLQQHPTISDGIYSRIAHGAIIPKPGIDRLDGDGVVLTDGSRVEVDLVVWCTGYRISFPFFDPDLLSADRNEIPLYFRTFHPRLRGLAFVGLLQPLGAIMPLAEAQGLLVADHLRGRYHLPPPETVEAETRRQRADTARRYVTSERHTIQVDFDLFLHHLRREHRAGQRRAARAGFALPLAA